MTTSLTQLIQIVEFASIGPGATEILPHNINVNNVPQAPDFVAADVGDLTIVVDATTVTVTNNGALASAPNIWLELKHTIQRAFGADQTTSLVPRPFIVASAGGGGGGGAARAFAYVATGTENLDGFPIAFTSLGTTNYAFAVSIVLANGDPNDMYDWIALGKFADHLQIATTQPPAAGDRFEVTITLYTP